MFNICQPYVILIMNMGWGCFIDCAIFTVLCSFFMLYLLLIPHDLYVYIVVDTSLYSYTLLIGYSLLSYLSLCLSCNLSQVQECNTHL